MRRFHLGKVAETSPTARWRAFLGRQVTTPSASTMAGAGFRRGATTLDPLNTQSSHVPAWQPSARYMQYKPVRFLVANARALATYQLFLEVGLTALFGSLIYWQYTTAERVTDALRAYHYPFVSWIVTKDCEFTEPVNAEIVQLRPEKLTALRLGHNIASGLLPVQVLVLAMTYPAVMRSSRAVMRMWRGGGRGKTAVKADATGAASASAAAPRKAAAAPAPAATARRASYARATTTSEGGSKLPL